MTMCETGDWIWTVRSRPKHDYVVVGCNDGSISMLQLIFSTVRHLLLLLLLLVGWVAFAFICSSFAVKIEGQNGCKIFSYVFLSLSSR
jgi:hypothetical protein